MTDEQARAMMVRRQSDPAQPNSSFIGWTTGYSGASVPHQKMASLVEAKHFKLSGMLSS